MSAITPGGISTAGYSKSSCGGPGFIGNLASVLPDRKSTRLNSSHRCISYALHALSSCPYTTLFRSYRICPPPRHGGRELFRMGEEFLPGLQPQRSRDRCPP